MNRANLYNHAFRMTNGHAEFVCLGDREGKVKLWVKYLSSGNVDKLLRDKEKFLKSIDDGDVKFTGVGNYTTTNSIEL